MNSSAPRVDSLISSKTDSSQEQYAGQPDEKASRRLARGYYPALCAACTIPPLVLLSSAFSLNDTGVVAVTGWSTLVAVYVSHVLIRMRENLKIGARKWDELCDNALALERAYEASEYSRERMIDKYNELYAKYLLERGAIPLVAKRAGGTAADSPSGVNGSAAVLEFPKGA